MNKIYILILAYASLSYSIHAAPQSTVRLSRVGLVATLERHGLINFQEKTQFINAVADKTLSAQEIVQQFDNAVKEYKEKELLEHGKEVVAPAIVRLRKGVIEGIFKDHPQVVAELEKEGVFAHPRKR